MKYALKSFNENMKFVLRDPDTDTGLSDKEAHEVIDRIITCIEVANDEELCAYKTRKRYQKEAFELLAKYWNQLWLWKGNFYYGN